MLHLEYAKEVLATAGIRMSPNTVFSLGIAQRQEDANKALDRNDNQNTKLSGTQGFLRVDVA